MNRLKPHLALLVCNVLWAMDYPFYNIVLPHYVHPMAMVSASLVATALFSLVPLLWQKAEKVERADIRKLIGAALLIGVYLLVSRQKIPFARIKKEVPLLLLSGAAMGVNWILLFEAYRYTSVSVATLSYYFAPVIVTLVCPILFHEKLTGKKFLCFVMSTLGLVLITGIGDTRGSDDLKGILFGLGAAVFYATVILLNKSIHQVEGIHRTFLQFLSAIVVLIPYVLSTNGITLSSLNAVGWVNLLIVGLVHTGITYCLHFSSLKELPGQEAAILSYIDPLVAVLVSVTLLGESMTAMQVIGGALILGFTLLNELSPTPKAKKK